MSQTKLFRSGLFACVIAICGGVAQATVLRAFVSSTGNDGNIGVNCAQATPCRTFNVAIGAVTPGGELIALDTAGYGPISNINKSITIAAIPGQTAFVVVAASTDGFLINTAPGDLVTLRNLTFNGSGAANNRGIIDHNSGKLQVEDCKFVNLFTGLSIINAKANLVNCIVSNNTIGAFVSGAGMDQSNQGSFATALLTIQGGSFIFNGTAIVLQNPGVPPLYNVYVLGPANNTFSTLFAQNTNFLTGTGTGCACSASGNIGTMQGVFSNPH